MKGSIFRSSDKSLLIFFPDNLEGTYFLDGEAKSVLTLSDSLLRNSAVVDVIISEEEQFANSN